METKKNKQNFLVLVPHRDSRIILRKYSDKLLTEGISGVYTFPLAAPLAALSEPLSADELKQAARSLRENNGLHKFNLTYFTSAAFPAGNGEIDLFGPYLNINTHEIVAGSAAKKIIKLFTPVVIGTFLIPKDNKEQARVGTAEPLARGSYSRSSRQNSSAEISLSCISFRAAAVANMHWQPGQLNNEKGFKWKIDRLTWLPKNI